MTSVISTGGRRGGSVNPDAKGNVLVGTAATQTLPNQSDNTFVGDKAGLTSTGGKDVAVGYEALNGKGAGTSDECNVCVGFQAGVGWAGEYATFVGAEAVARITGTLAENTFIGYKAGEESTVGTLVNVAIGSRAAKENTGQLLMAMGPEAAAKNTGNEVVAIGAGACLSNEAAKVVAIGAEAAGGNLGAEAVAVGVKALEHSDGKGAVAVGQEAGLELGGALAHGDDAILIGRKAGAKIKANNVILIGALTTTSVSDVVVLGREFGAAEKNQKGIIFGSAGSAEVLGGGEGVVALNNRKAKPTTNHPSGGILYAEGGALFWRGSAGSVTEIAKA